MFSTNGYSVHIALKKPCSELHKARKRKQPSQQRGEIDDPESHGYNDEPVGHAHDDAGHVPHFPSDEPDDSGANQAGDLKEDESSTRDTNNTTWIHTFPCKHGLPAGARYGRRQTTHDTILEDERRHRLGAYGHFESEADWQLGRWLVQNLGQNQIDEFLKLDSVSVV